MLAELENLVGEDLDPTDLDYELSKQVVKSHKAYTDPQENPPHSLPTPLESVIIYRLQITAQHREEVKEAAKKISELEQALKSGQESAIELFHAANNHAIQVRKLESENKELVEALKFITSITGSRYWPQDVLTWIFSISQKAHETISKYNKNHEHIKTPDTKKDL